MDIRFQILSDTSYLSFIRGFIEAQKMPERLKRKCSMAIVEAVDNAIFHAHKGDRSVPIEIMFSRKGGKIRIGIRDLGKGFDIDMVPRPDLYQINGRGLFIVKSLMDGVEYDNNTLRMWCHEK